MLQGFSQKLHKNNTYHELNIYHKTLKHVDHSSVQSVMPNSLRPHGVQQARPPCPSLTPRAYSNSCPSSWWCHPTISSSVIPFSSRLQSLSSSGSLLKSQFFMSGGQIIGASASASVLPKNIQDWFPLGWTGWISLQSKGLSRIFSNTSVQKHQFFGTHLSLWSNSFFYFPTSMHTQSQSLCLSIIEVIHIEITSVSLWSSSFSKCWGRTKLSLVSFIAAYPLPLSWFLTLITLHWGIHTIAGPFLRSLGC